MLAASRSNTSTRPPIAHSEYSLHRRLLPHRLRRIPRLRPQSTRSGPTRHALDAPQQELAEAARLFDLSKHRFHDLLSQSIRCFDAAVVDLLSHPLGPAVRRFFRSRLSGAWRGRAGHSRRRRVLRALRDWIRCRSRSPLRPAPAGGRDCFRPRSGTSWP